MKFNTKTSKYINNVPCFAEWCTAKLENGDLIKMDKIRAGHMVYTEEGFAKVICVIKTHCKNGKVELVNFPRNLGITPFHPVKFGNEWIYPYTQLDVEIVRCGAVYSFLLEDGYYNMVINGWTCITLAHGRTDGILAHPYYGTRAIIEDLKKKEGWNSRYIQLNAGCIIMDKNGMCQGLTQTPKTESRLSNFFRMLMAP
jgi:hypothetical protein